MILHYFVKHYMKLNRNDVESEKNIVMNMVEEFFSLNSGGV